MHEGVDGLLRDKGERYQRGRRSLKAWALPPSNETARPPYRVRSSGVGCTR